MCGDEADLQGWNQSDMQRFSESDTETRMIKGPSDAVGASFPSRGRLATRCFKPTIYTDSWFVEPAIFYATIPAIQDPRPVTVSILNRQRGRHMQGGWREA